MEILQHRCQHRCSSLSILRPTKCHFMDIFIGTIAGKKNPKNNQASFWTWKPPTSVVLTINFILGCVKLLSFSTLSLSEFSPHFQKSRVLFPVSLYTQRLAAGAQLELNQLQPQGAWVEGQHPVFPLGQESSQVNTFFCILFLLKTQP